MFRIRCVVLSLTAFCALGASSLPSERFYQAIRNNNSDQLKKLIAELGPNTKDGRSTTALMIAAAYGTVDSMELLLNAGADVNARNAFGATALMWCATQPPKVKLLLDKGADVNIQTPKGRGALLIATMAPGNTEVAKLLLARGAKIDSYQLPDTPLVAAANVDATQTVNLLLEQAERSKLNVHALGIEPALINAAAEGNVELVQLLLARGADVNARAPDPIGAMVKNGTIDLGAFTALHLAAASGGHQTVKVLLDAGADPNALDRRGMTPLMFAIATDRPDLDTIRLLLTKTTNLTVQAKNKLAALDWARSFNTPEVLKAMNVDPSPAVASFSAEVKPALLDAVSRSLHLLQQTSSGFLKEGGCVSCHAQNLTAVAVNKARAQGLSVNEAAAAGDAKANRFQWSGEQQRLLVRLDPPGAADMVAYGALEFTAENVAADPVTDAMVHNLLEQQMTTGNWHDNGILRAPLQDGDFAATALSILTLRRYGMPGRKTEIDSRVERAAAWLRDSKTYNSEDRNMQLLGLKWAGTLDSAKMLSVIASQDKTGGWAQKLGLPPDAFATGETLYVLHELGMPTSDPVYQRGVDYLLRTQASDGSWHVVSRTAKLQPYFQSGFPYDHDQWISMAGTAWAATALAAALEPASTVAVR